MTKRTWNLIGACVTTAAILGAAGPADALVSPLSEMKKDVEKAKKETKKLEQKVDKGVVAAVHAPEKAILSGKALCREVIKAIDHPPSPALTAWAKVVLAPAAKAAKVANTGTKAAMTSAATAARSDPKLTKYFTELNRLQGRAATVDQLRSILGNADLMCSSNRSAINAALTQAGLKPDKSLLARADKAGERSWMDSFGRLFLGTAAASTPDRHFFMEYGAKLGLAAVLGGEVSVSFVTDFTLNDTDGTHSGLFLTFGPSLVTNVAGGLMPFVNFYPSASLSDFSGDISSFSSWNWELTITAGRYGLGGAVTDVFDHQLGVDPFSASHLIGFGFMLGLSGGVLPGDGTFAAITSMLMAQ